METTNNRLSQTYGKEVEKRRVTAGRREGILKI